MTACTIQHAVFTFIRCGRPDAVPVRSACVHEHIEDGDACPRCRADTSAWFCSICADIDGHECPVLVQELTHEGWQPVPIASAPEAHW